jgi:DNA-binding PadR family transcriptional regulator
MSSEKLTTPDLVLLSLLAERPMHGYEANALLEFRKVRDWAGVSRPQVYYSLEKLARLGLIEATADDSEKAGPERHVFSTTPEGKAALADALERGNWAEQVDRPAFLTWLALSWQCRPGVFQRQLRRRQDFLRQELARKQEILQHVLQEVGHPFHEAVWMLSLSIDQLKVELAWAEQVAHEFPRRGPAHNRAFEAR